MTTKRPACPHGEPLPDEVIRDCARYLGSQRKLGAVGAPRSRKKRCPCGLMTAKRAEARRHVCQP